MNEGFQPPNVLDFSAFHTLQENDGVEPNCFMETGGDDEWHESGEDSSQPESDEAVSPHNNGIIGKIPWHLHPDTAWQECLAYHYSTENQIRACRAWARYLADRLRTESDPNANRVPFKRRRKKRQ